MSIRVKRRRWAPPGRTVPDGPVENAMRMDPHRVPRQGLSAVWRAAGPHESLRNPSLEDVVAGHGVRRPLDDVSDRPADDHAVKGPTTLAVGPFTMSS